MVSLVRVEMRVDDSAERKLQHFACERWSV